MTPLEKVFVGGSMLEWPEMTTCNTPLEKVFVGGSMLEWPEMTTCNRCERTPVSKHHVCEDRLLSAISELKDQKKQAETLLARMTHERDQCVEQLHVVQARCTELLEECRELKCAGADILRAWDAYQPDDDDSPPLAEVCIFVDKMRKFRE